MTSALHNEIRSLLESLKDIVGNNTHAVGAIDSLLSRLDVSVPDGCDVPPAPSVPAEPKVPETVAVAVQPSEESKPARKKRPYHRRVK